MPDALICPHCQATNAAGSLYCDQCSLPLRAGATLNVTPRAEGLPGGAGLRPAGVGTASAPPLPPFASPVAGTASAPPPIDTAGAAPPGTASAPPAATVGTVSAPPPPLVPPPAAAARLTAVAAPAPVRSGPPPMLIGGALVAVVVFLVGMGIVLGGALNPPAAAPTPNVPALIQFAVGAEATRQSAQIQATLTALPAVNRDPARETAVTLAVATVDAGGTAPATPTAVPAIATAVAAAPTAPPTTAPAALTVPLSALNQSGESGTAVISDEFDHGTRIVIHLSGAPAASQPAHIHLGTCDNIAPKPSFPLKNVVNGQSDTLLAVPFDEIRRGVYLINVHTSATRLEPYVACGIIP